MFPCFSYYKQCCYEHVCTNISLRFAFKSFRHIPKSGTAESYGGSVFHFLRNLQLFSTAAAAFSVPTSRAQEFQFLQELPVQPPSQYSYCFTSLFPGPARLTSVPDQGGGDGLWAIQRPPGASGKTERRESSLYPSSTFPLSAQ